MRQATAIVVALAAVMLAAPAPAPASAFKFSHRLTITVEYRYDWSVTPGRPDCGRSGSGFFHAKVSTKPVRVAAGQNRTANRFVIGVPYGPRGIRDLGSRRLLGTYEVANNAPFVGQCAGDNATDTERSSCGTKPIPRRAIVLASGVSRRRIEANDNEVSGSFARCIQPALTEIDDPFRPRELSIKPPSKRQLRRHSVTVSGRQSVSFNIDEGDVGTATAVRTIRLTFTRL